MIQLTTCARRTGNDFNMTWTLAGAGVSSLFENHEYMLFRYGQVICTQSLNFDVLSITGWRVKYTWVEEDSAFGSSDSVLNSVWELCRNTIKVTSLDTFTDSNTRFVFMCLVCVCVCVCVCVDCLCMCLLLVYFA